MKNAVEQLELISRGADQIVPIDELKKKLERSVAGGKALRIKYGIDPTGIDVHLGHTVPLRKLRLFQELGHKAVLIIGNYTALVGDPSGRDQTRSRLSEEQVAANARDYLKQVSKVIDISQTEVRYNGEWFSRFAFLDVLGLMRKITVQRMLERDDFTKRRESGTPIYLHECLYPLMQGQDSVEIRADVELGGSEQLFSLMVGRELQRDAGQEPQVCLTLPILRGLDGARRMGKSLGNYVGVAESAYEMFAKTMSGPDAIMREWFELLTDRSTAEINELTSSDQNPRASKEILGKDIVTFYYGQPAAEQAAAEWTRRFSGGHDPSQIPVVKIEQSALKGDGSMWICDLLVRCGLAPSKNEARRHVTAGAVSIGPDRSKITDATADVHVGDGLIVRIGNRKIAKISLGS